MIGREVFYKDRLYLIYKYVERYGFCELQEVHGNTEIALPLSVCEEGMMNL
jgi:hypothetical protein